MAESASLLRSPAGSWGNPRFRFWFFAGLDAFVVVSALATALVVFWIYEDANRRTYTALGYGWVPVILWCGGVLATLRYCPRFLFRPWRWWLAGAGAVVLVIGILTYFHPDYGALRTASMGGHWGQAIVGESAWLGALKLLGVALVIPLIVYPYSVSRAYWVALFNTGKGIWFVLALLALGAQWAARKVAAGVRRLAYILAHRETRPPWLTAVVEWRPRRRAVAVAAAVEVVEKPVVVKAVPAAPPPPVVAPANLSPVAVKGSQWQLPPMELLAPAESRQRDDRPLKQMAVNIEKALADHGVSVEVADIKAGPRIVRFGLMPGWMEKRGRDKGDGMAASERRRVQVGSILAREKDLALAISAPSLRFEPVPGEALLGLELPTPTPSKVTMREVMEAQDFRKIVGKGGLPIALGADAGGEAVAMDLAALPHVMIAGATGSGKSVCINSIIASFLMTKPPDQLRMLMVDPKQVELTPFNGIPHLVLPVITDVDEVSPMLKGLVREMNRRYKQMSEINTRNIAGYNAKAKEPIPYIVLIVDELADLMMVGGAEVEHSLVRLAQMGRASGIHLVLATQRPSKEVVTGLLKANVPAKVAFAVATQVNARVILDAVGAEKLLGKGDMLLANNDSPQPRRVQGTLVFDEEIEQLVDFWLEQKGPPLPAINLEEFDGVDGDEADAGGLDEETLEKARELALRNPHLSSSLLERRLKIGGSRAGQILEELEEEGLVIPR